MPVCAECGHENPEGFRFCGNCAAALPTETVPVRELRKTVTLLFCDVTGSTALGERLDPEALRRVMRRYFDEISAVIERHGGTVEKFVGDAVMAVFGIPRVQEDDAMRAVRAAAEVRERLPGIATELGVELLFRTGVNTGEVVVGAGQTLATGDAVNVAARLEQAAEPGEILIGAETRRLVRDAVVVEPVGPLALKGKAEPVEAFRLLRVDPGAPGLARRLDAPLIGRERELRVLREAFERAVGERGCHLFTLLGSAGVGKSRLVAELLAGLEAEATIVRGRCLHYGEGITFWPLVEMLMELGERAAGVLGRVTEGGVASPNELFLEVRRLLEEVAREQPLVAVFDDLQWAEPMLLDLLDHVADLSRGAPILLLCVARPELLEERAGWGGGKFNATTVLLEPLGVDECGLLLGSLGDELDATSRARVIEVSEGIPLFLEEMVALVREGGEGAVPPTIQALIAARLERLREEERAVIERGAVEGKIFHRGAVDELLPESQRPQLDTQLAALVRKELIRPETPTFTGDDAFLFRHLLIRDAAYEALSKETRAELHASFAGWLEQHGADLVELDEIAGWHLEQAVRYRRELGLALDRSLAARAAEHLAAAGRRAAARPDVRASDNLLTRALELLPPTDDRRPDVALALAEAIIQAGQADRADGYIREAEGDPRTRHKAVPVRVEWLLHTKPSEAVRFAEAELPGAIEHFHEENDEGGLAKAHLALFNVHWLASRAGPAAEELAEAARHARRTDERDLLARALTMAQSPLIYGPDDPATVRRKLSDIEGAGAGPFAFGPAMVRSFLAQIEGRFEEARAHAQRAKEILGELGKDVFRAALGQGTGAIEMAAGDYPAAVREFRHSYDELGRLGEHAFRSTTAAMLAEALYQDGRPEEAEQMALAAEEESAAEDAINFAIAGGVLARIRADRGEFGPAEELARSAVAHAFQTDFPIIRADSTRTLAHILSAAGRPDEAAEALEQALGLYEQKGDQVSAGKVRALLDEWRSRSSSS